MCAIAGLMGTDNPGAVARVEEMLGSSAIAAPTEAECCATELPLSVIAAWRFSVWAKRAANR